MVATNHQMILMAIFIAHNESSNDDNGDSLKINPQMIFVMILIAHNKSSNDDNGDINCIK